MLRPSRPNSSDGHDDDLNGRADVPRDDGGFEGEGTAEPVRGGGRLRALATSARRRVGGLTGRDRAGDAVAAQRDQQPLRGDLYSADQLAQHARTLAGWHEVDTAPDAGHATILRRLDENRRVLDSTYGRVVAAAERGRPIAPAAEWLIDNFYLIETQIRLARRHLPRGYARELPHLTNGPNAGLPRVYDLALELIRHTDGQVEATALDRFVGAYQSSEPLRLGELWAVPIMLRIALIENLRRVAVRIGDKQADQDAAAHWAGRTLEAARRDPKATVQVLAAMYEAMADPDDPSATGKEADGEGTADAPTVRLSPAFVAEFSRRLQGQAATGVARFPLEWLGQALGERGQSVESLVGVEGQRQAADQVSVGNTVGALRFVESHDWPAWVEGHSAVERALLADPAGVYDRQDFATRDLYRHAVEKVAARSPHSEERVAELAVGRAREGEAIDGPDAPAAAHVGRQLIGERRPTFERAAGMRPDLRQSTARVLRAAPLAWFAGTAAALTLLLAAGVLGWSLLTGAGVALVVGLAVPVLLAATGPAVAVVNWLVTQILPPRRLPRLDYDDGIPASARTVVVVPSMLTGPDRVDELVDGLEVRHFANPDEHLHFALLTDLPDSDEEIEAGDAALIDRAARAVSELDARHGFGDGEKFMLLHRPRRWNEQEGVWMGWERKRGKLVEFNALVGTGEVGAKEVGGGQIAEPEAGRGLSSGSDSGSAHIPPPSLPPPFSTSVARTDLLASCQYVITLDADTELPRGAARRLVGTADHPLNRPVYDEALGRVTRGYGILQPRVGTDLPSAAASWYSRVMGGEPGIDPYTNAVSDVYQDAFGEGSFVGKGIYHAATFERACGGGRFGENEVLSHDLIESALARSGLVGDVVLYEDFPASYLADAARRHRWTRGDWQIARYAMPWTPGPSGLSKWKILDNLRRSLVPAAIVLALVIAWVVDPGAAWAWSLLAIGYFFAPPLLSAGVSLGRSLLADDGGERPARMRAAAVWRSLKVDWARAALSLCFLPHEAWVNVDAIARALWRKHVSHKKLLEWTTAADAERRARGDGRSFAEAMWPAWLLGIAVLAYFAGRGAWANALAVLPIAGLWLASPLVAHHVSRRLPRRTPSRSISEADRRFLRKVARRTWTFFDAFVAAPDHFLPPDNYQEPRPAAPSAEQVASRTSPTNIGLALLANLAARDFGHVTLGQLLDRTERTLGGTERLERHASGHLYNWYDTRSLQPLSPRYVSSVDSGNFVASLHVLRSGLTELIDRPAIDPACWGGFADVARLFLDACRGHGRVSLPGDADDADAEATAKRPGERVRLPAELAGRLEQLAAECERGGPAKLSGAKMLLQNLSIAASEAGAAVAGQGEGEPKRWAVEMSAQIRHFAEELHHLCPWVDLVGPGTAPVGRGAPVGVDAAARQRQRLVEQALIELENYPTLRRVADLLDAVVPAAERLRDDLQNATLRPHADFPYHERAARILRDSAERSRDRIAALRDLAGRCTPLIECDWSLLYDRGRHLLHIGYNCAERRADAGYYDLLASEMRLGSFALVATGVAPQEHWFRLGRQTTLSPGGHPTLLSWSGSMFEYLMPLLMMPQHAGTLLDETCQGVVARQREYARDNGIKRGVPWGVSESGYSATDAALTYQYRPFGVPGLGYKRGLGEDLVIAPYATMMAAMVDPTAAAANLRRLRDEGRMGRHGFFEAIDYTPARVKRGRQSATVRQYMAHHQAMGLLGLAAVLLDGQPGPVQPGGASTLPARAPGVLEGPMQRRLMSSAAFRSAELLLHERVPRSAAPAFPHAGEHAGSRRGDPRAAGTLRIFTSVDDLQTPEVHLLSNGRLSVMVTAAGGGYARWDAGEGDALAVTRWQEDATRDARGSFAYVRDVDTGEFWGTTRQPVPREPLRYEAIFSQARAEFRRVDAVGEGRREVGGGQKPEGSGSDQPTSHLLAPTSSSAEVETYTQVSVSPEDDVEVRRVTVTNNGRRARTLELTSYAEVVLAPPTADAAHPAFQNLFVQTRLVRGRQAILARRRARQPGERTPYLVHLVACYGDEVGEPQYETDRAAFVGRGRSLADPAAMHAARLGDSSGSVLDSIASVRRAVRLEPGEKATFDVVTGVADTNEAAHALIEKYHDRRLCDRVGELAWTHSQILLRQLGIDEADAQAYGRLAGSVIHATPQRRAPADVIARNLEANRKQSNLWAYGISGDLPIVLVRVGDLSRAKLVEEAVRAHAYWRRKGLRCDLVVWNEDSGGYRGETHDAILAAVARAGEDDLLDRPGGVFVRRVEQFAEADRNLVLALARVVLSDKAGPLAEQVGGPKRGKTRPAAPPLVVQPRRKLAASAAAAEADPAAELRSRPGLLFRNGLGGFTPDGKEYVVTIAPETPTPAPWSNVIANDDFGTLVTESGGGYTWRTNAREFRLTPFYNDPVTDVSGEALYVRDEETGRFWSPTPLPARGGDALHDPARLRLQRLRVRRGGHRQRAGRVRPPRRPGQADEPEAPQTRPTAGGACRRRRSASGC